jgi:glycosyltransferase involved in cell wall biosynthesis
MLKTLDIVLPCYNPLNNWEKEVLNTFLSLKAKLASEYLLKLYIVNDGSKSDLDIAFTFLKNELKDNLKVLKYQQNKGKGHALRQGISETTADLIIYTDIDFPYKPVSFLRILKALESTDIAIGIRDESYYKGIPKKRVLISKALRFILKHFLKLKITDTQCGLKGINKKAKATFLMTTIDRYLFDMEFIYLASKNHELSLAPVNVELREGIVMSEMNSSILVSEFKNFLKIIF